MTTAPATPQDADIPAPPAEKTRSLTIRTPEGIEFALQLASPACRCLAWGVDALVVVALVILLAQALQLLQLLAPDIAAAVLTVGTFAIQFGYGLLFEWGWRGQTLGKRLFGIRVADARGLRVRFSQIVIRNLLRVADMPLNLAVVGGVAALLSPRGQRLGDLAAATIVVRIPRPAEPDLRQIEPDKFNSFRQHPHLCARLRQRTTPEVAAIALQAVLRRDRLDPEARVTLFREIAEQLRRHAAFPQEVTDTLSDERYVRNAVDVLYRVAG